VEPTTYLGFCFLVPKTSILGNAYANATHLRRVELTTKLGDLSLVALSSAPRFRFCLQAPE